MTRFKPGLNVHLYPSDFLHESRIEKIAAVLRDLAIFESVWLVGIATSGLPAREELDRGISLFRVGQQTMRKSFLMKMVAFVRYYLSVVVLLRKVHVSCVNAHSLSVLPLAIFLKLFKGSLVVYDTHELETETHSLTGVRQKFAKLVERAFIRKADAIFCVSKKISEWYAAAYRLPEPVTVLNSPELGSQVESTALRDRLGLPAHRKIFLYLGELGPGRGLELLLDAFNTLPEGQSVMVFVGYGSLAETITRSPVYGKNVFHLPAVPRREVPSLAASADVGICVVAPTCLSYNYCMPNKLFEYLASGVPVLVSSCVSLQEFVIQNQIGFVLDEMTPQGVRREIERLANSDLSAMRVKARATAVDHAWQVQEGRLKSAYQELLDRNGQSA